MTPFEHNCRELCNIYKNEGVVLEIKCMKIYLNETLCALIIIMFTDFDTSNKDSASNIFRCVYTRGGLTAQYVYGIR